LALAIAIDGLGLAIAYALQRWAHRAA
jgi:hypothetical protein